ncbi:MAG: hypothetical protein R6V32_02600 [Bacteroidales bacterium]
MKCISVCLFLIIMLVSCTDDEPSTNDNEAKIRLVNVSQTAFDSLILRYEGHLRWQGTTFSHLLPEDTSQYKNLGNIQGEIRFHLWADSIEYTENWQNPVSISNPMNPSSNYYPTGYYTFTIIETDDSTQSGVVGLTDFDLY